jgi:hypothetical protein
MIDNDRPTSYLYFCLNINIQLNLCWSDGTLLFLFELAAYSSYLCKVKFEDTNGVIRRRKSKQNRQYNDQKRKKEQSMIHKTLHTEVKIKQHKPH